MIKLSKNLNSFKNLICRCLNIPYRSMSLDLIYSNSIRDLAKKFKSSSRIIDY